MESLRCLEYLRQEQVHPILHLLREFEEHLPQQQEQEHLPQQQEQEHQVEPSLWRLRRLPFRNPNPLTTRRWTR